MSCVKPGDGSTGPRNPSPREPGRRRDHKETGKEQPEGREENERSDFAGCTEKSGSKWKE